MHPNTSAFTKLALPASWHHALLRPLIWVLAWAFWSLLALAWFGYQDALAGWVCSSS